MDIAKQLAVYLQNAGYGTLGTSIFVGQIPASIDGLYVMRTSGTLNNYVPLETTIVDIFVKDQNSEQAITRIENIKRYIHRMHNTVSASSYIYSMLVISDVETIERTDDYQKIYKISVEVMHRALSLIS
jgi:hypothetical protein